MKATKELAFEIGKEKFYRVTGVQDMMTAGRYLHARDDITLYATFGLKRENIAVFFDKLEEVLNEGKLGDAFLILNEFRKQMTLFSEVDLVYRIAARVFFKEEDNLAFDIEPEELDRRVELFKKKEIASLLLTEPLKSLLSLAESLSLDSLNFLTRQDQILRKTSIDWLMTMGTLSRQSSKK